MNLISTAALACATALAGAACLAQPAAPAVPAKAASAPARVVASPSASPGTAEPKVERTVIEDDGARIDELKVRGQTQRIVVSPKRGGTAPYEIITGDGSRDLGDGANTSRGAAGKRVWNVLKF